MPKTRTLYRTQSADDELAATAADAIRWLTTLPDDAIRVTAQNGWLCLEGAVAWRHQRSTAEDVLRHLPGVKGIRNSIRIESDPAFAEVRAILA